MCAGSFATTTNSLLQGSKKGTNAFAATQRGRKPDPSPPPPPAPPPAPPPPPPPRPRPPFKPGMKNVLFIMSAELNVYGSTHMHTPNFDKLGASSTVFERGYIAVS
eukprot:gene14071-biopygen24129